MRAAAIQLTSTTDVDRNLREMGVGDMGVGPQDIDAASPDTPQSGADQIF